MLETIVEWLAGALGSLLDWIFSYFTDALSLSLGKLVSYFPFFSACYDVLKYFGYGLAVCIAVIYLFRYFTRPVSEIRETPVMLLVRIGFFAVLMNAGGYAIEMIVDLAALPYHIIENTDTAETATDFSEWVDMFADAPSASDLSLGSEMTSLLALLAMLAVGWNIFKLMLEVCERYVMVGVIAFTSPLVFSTVVSPDTENIFRKWVSMFLGQCILMTVSVWTFKVVISGLKLIESDEVILVRLILVLAMCKIALRMDTYMQQLGVGVGTTGSNLLDDVIFSVKAVQSAAKGGRSAAGAASKPLGRAYQGARNAYAEGAGIGGIMREAGRSAAGIKKKDEDEMPLREQREENIRKARDEAENAEEKEKFNDMDTVSGESSRTEENMDAEGAPDSYQDTAAYDGDDQLNSENDFPDSLSDDPEAAAGAMMKAADNTEISDALTDSMMKAILPDKDSGRYVYSGGRFRKSGNGSAVFTVSRKDRLTGRSDSVSLKSADGRSFVMQVGPERRGRFFSLDPDTAYASELISKMSGSNLKSGERRMMEESAARIFEQHPEAAKAAVMAAKGGTRTGAGLTDSMVKAITKESYSGNDYAYSDGLFESNSDGSVTFFASRKDVTEGREDVISLTSSDGHDFSMSFDASDAVDSMRAVSSEPYFMSAEDLSARDLSVKGAVYKIRQNPVYAAEMAHSVQGSSEIAPDAADTFVRGIAASGFYENSPDSQVSVRDFTENGLSAVSARVINNHDGMRTVSGTVMKDGKERSFSWISDRNRFDERQTKGPESFFDRRVPGNDSKREKRSNSRSHSTEFAGKGKNM